LTLESEQDAIRRIARDVVKGDRTLVRRRYMVVVGSPSGGRVDLAEEDGGDAVSNAAYLAGLTLTDGDAVLVLVADGQPIVIGEFA
jgi:hypothetical protein